MRETPICKFTFFDSLGYGNNYSYTFLPICLLDNFMNIFIFGQLIFLFTSNHIPDISSYQGAILSIQES